MPEADAPHVRLSLARLERDYDAYFGSSLATANGVLYDDGECPSSDTPRPHCRCPVCVAERRLNPARIGFVLAVRAYRAKRERLLENYPVAGVARYEALRQLAERAYVQAHWLAPTPAAPAYRKDFEALLEQHLKEATIEWRADRARRPEPELIF